MSEQPAEHGQPEPTAPPAHQQQPNEAASKTFTQEDVNRLLAAEKRRAESRFGDYDALKEKASKADELFEAQKTDQQRAIDEVRKQTRSEVLATVGPQLVAAEFRAQAAGILLPEQVEGLLEDLNTANYLDKQGRVDIDRVKNRVASLASARPQPFPDLGGGQRGAQTTAESMDQLIRAAAGR